ncbi:hypothetical protein Csa_009298 [Cucumis sativus]|uniref:Uncharacterized protein n=1 Tax=Cucumis sativus TaxID=3659 RepID=A0A0A0KS08_CUCSA|nr:hypothetical protein Csa_009298 [Cucumis sativus]
MKLKLEAKSGMVVLVLIIILVVYCAQGQGRPLQRQHYFIDPFVELWEMKHSGPSPSGDGH